MASWGQEEVGLRWKLGADQGLNLDPDKALNMDRLLNTLAIRVKSDLRIHEKWAKQSNCKHSQHG